MERESVLATLGLAVRERYGGDRHKRVREDIPKGIEYIIYMQNHANMYIWGKEINKSKTNCACMHRQQQQHP